MRPYWKILRLWIARQNPFNVFDENRMRSPNGHSDVDLHTAVSGHDVDFYATLNDSNAHRNTVEYVGCTLA